MSSQIPLTNESPALSKEAVLSARLKLIGPNVQLNYNKSPLMIVKGEMQYLIDEVGNRYLDCVNNVCHVGHCHPKTVAAVQNQFAELQTNSRYLHPTLVEYSKILTDSMPGDLKVVYWVNSGSEANDLALRMSRAYTGRRGVITVGSAYHGHTTEVINISPYKYARKGGLGRVAYVKEAAEPDVYSGKYRGSLDDESVTEKYVSEIRVMLEEFSREEKAEAALLLERSSRLSSSPTLNQSLSDEQAYRDQYLAHDGLKAGCGAFIMESILSCGGQIVPPANYLRSVYAAVRAAGGVCIADEVQVGFGRVGTHMWAFQLQGEDVVPDIVTLGKPMGNGYPVACVVTTPAVAAAFSNGMEYFNTYGGNPGAAAVSLATWKAMHADRLLENAVIVGAILVDGFNKIRDKYQAGPVIVGSSRGVGLMVGLEFVKDLESREADGEAAVWIKYEALKHFTLLTTDGMFDQVIKLKPPMCFSAENAVFVIDLIDKLIQQLVQLRLSQN